MWSETCRAKTEVLIKTYSLRPHCVSCWTIYIIITSSKLVLGCVNLCQLYTENSIKMSSKKNSLDNHYHQHLYHHHHELKSLDLLRPCYSSLRRSTFQLCSVSPNHDVLPNHTGTPTPIMGDDFPILTTCFLHLRWSSLFVLWDKFTALRLKFSAIHKFATFLFVQHSVQISTYFRSRWSDCR